MDIKTQLIENITTSLLMILNKKDLFYVQDALISELNNYDIIEKCTSLSISHDNTIAVFKKYVATKRVEGLSENTIQRYVTENRKLIEYINKPINEITTYDIRYYLSYKKKCGLANNTLDGMRRCFSAFFSWLQAEKIIIENPCISVAQIKCQKQIKKPFSPVELEKIRLVCTDARDRALIEFLNCTGCRVTEVQNLNIGDIDFETSECTVLGKGNKERIVYITPIAKLFLQKYLETRTYTEDDALFTGKHTDRIHKNGIEALLRRIGKAAGVENVHPHRFRRTFATNMLDRGMDIQDVATILGHADLKTTQIYCYISQSNVKASFNKYSM